LGEAARSQKQSDRRERRHQHRREALGGVLPEFTWSLDEILAE